ADFFGEPDELQVGGWVGAVAGQLAALGAEVVVYARPFSRKQAALFDSKIKVPTAKGKKLSFVPARRAAREGEVTRENWVLRFNAGDSLRLGDSFVTAPRSCSLVVLESEGTLPFFHEELEPAIEVLGKKVDVALFSGFHSMRESRESRKQFALVVRHLKALQKSKRVLLHWEYNPFESPALEKKFLAACRGVFDSIDVNEPELVYLLELLGCSKQAKEIEKQENAFSIFEGARRVLEKLNLKRIQVHSVGFHTVVLRKPYAVSPQRVRDACLFASLVATTKALTGARVVTLADLKASPVASVSDTGLNQLGVLEAAIAPELLKTMKMKFSSKMRREYFANGIIELRDCFVLVVPAPIATTVKTTSGLGSVFSAVFVAKERS
ncbi:MAG: ADP-dependent glucokinase/phosphofructokinase, partial [Candidatus Norongarragalinales archaeon]